MWKYFGSSIIATVFGLLAAVGVGHYYGEPLLQVLFITVVLSILEVSLSFDNAIVNAVILRKMTPLWRHRFLTWGMLIAVFGMRLVFPVLIVTFVAWVTPWQALLIAATSPDEYARMMLSAHNNVSAFGGAFLMMVALKYFYDEHKDEHWIKAVEAPAAYLGRIEAIDIALTLILLTFVSRSFTGGEGHSYLVAGIAGLIVYVVVDGLGAFLEKLGTEKADIHKASAGMFLYLEVLDASFSFDGVVGAFAVTHNLFIIMIGLSIGAFFVRSLTIMFVEKETLTKFAYLEHGAFYAIGALAFIMLFHPVLHTPEWITGLIGAVFIIASFGSSLRKMKRAIA